MHVRAQRVCERAFSCSCIHSPCLKNSQLKKEHEESFKAVLTYGDPLFLQCRSNTVCSVRVDVYDMFHHFELELIICDKFAHYEVRGLLNEIR